MQTCLEIFEEYRQTMNLQRWSDGESMMDLEEYGTLFLLNANQRCR